jgi:hypothetical protein
MDQKTLPASNYGYSAVNPKHLGASEYTLVTVCVDSSGSVVPFKGQLEECLRKVVQSCQYSPRADNLLVRIVQFDHALDQIHGFKMLENCNVSDYKRILTKSGSTALYDTAVNAVRATLDYAGDLKKQRYTANAVVFLLTDGCDNVSKFTARDVRRAIDDAVHDENLESVNTILVGVNINDPMVGKMLGEFKQEAGLTQYEDIGALTPERAARLADFVSRSISAQAQAKGTGGPSKALVF